MRTCVAKRSVMKLHTLGSMVCMYNTVYACLAYISNTPASTHTQIDRYTTISTPSPHMYARPVRLCNIQATGIIKPCLLVGVGEGEMCLV